MMILVLLLIITLQLNNFHNHSIQLIRSPKSSYKAQPLITYSKLSQRPSRFKKLTTFTIEVFDNIIVPNLRDWIELPRNYYSRHGSLYNQTVDFNQIHIATRGAILSTEDRILRWIFMLRGVKSYLIEEIFDQDISVALRDFIHICKACINGLGRLYLRELVPGSQECNNLKGKNVFKHFPNVMYAADVTKVCIYFFLFKYIWIFSIALMFPFFSIALISLKRYQYVNRGLAVKKKVNGLTVITGSTTLVF